MRNLNILSLVLAAALLAPWAQARAESYKVRLYDPANPNNLQVTGAAEFAINRTPDVYTTNQGGCATAPAAFQVTELKVVVDGVEKNFTGYLDATICRMQSNKPVNYAPGTACLDQGVNLGWVSGTLSQSGTYNGGTVTYYVDFKAPTTAWTNGCSASDEPVFVRKYDVKRNRTKLIENGNFAVPNIVRAAPEPGSLPLFLAGFAALGLLAWTRSRRAALAARR